MQVKFRVIRGCLATLCLITPAQAWQSELYDGTWDGGRLGSFYTDKIIQDFSHAGYHRGERLLPAVEGPLFTVTDYGADPNGLRDSTVAIQSAIINAENAGGGVVYMPPGLYLVSPTNTHCLFIRKSHVVLRGAGPAATFLLNTSHAMRSRNIIHVENPSSAAWSSSGGNVTPITQDLIRPTCVIPVGDTTGYAPGQWVIVRNTITDAWILEHKEPEWLGHGERLGGLRYCRQLVAVNHAAKTVTLDVPIRYALLQRDNARMYLAPELLEEVGLEDFAIGNVQHPGQAWGSGDYAIAGRAAFDVHASYAINMRRSRNGWIRNVRSFQAEGNSAGCHILSNGILVRECRGITVEDCHFARPQYGGGGGNGYMYRVMANECLISECTADFSRHGLVLSHMLASGNVFYNCLDARTRRATGSTGSYTTSGASSDHHMHFSHSNLFDNCKAIDSYYAAAYRPYGSIPKHNLTAAHSTYWNMVGEGSYNYVVHTQQSRYGYVIGTSGSSSSVRVTSVGGSSEKTDPADHIEGLHRGASLEPTSLYWDQLSQRLEQGNLVAHWALDERQGVTAHESVGGSHGEVSGHAIWRPGEGIVDGALHFEDGESWIDTGFSFNPGEHLFSVFAWVKGGSPGQVIFAQRGQRDWLYANAHNGYLTCDIRTTGRSSPLPSQSVITDGDWHRVGLVWDGADRTLYLDDVEVARDTRTGLRPASGGLIIGAGANLDQGNFWTGWIDDVRVFDRAISP